MKRSWSSSLGVLVLWLAAGCGAARNVGTTRPSRTPVSASSQISAAAPVAQESAKGAHAFDYEHESDADEVFLRETERSIALYRQFIERAGDDPAYADQVKKSRQQIEDLTAARIFVLNGLTARKNDGK